MTTLRMIAIDDDGGVTTHDGTEADGAGIVTDGGANFDGLSWRVE